jgi:hypothetical protein
VKPPRIPNEGHRRIVRDTIQNRIAKAQVRKSLLHSATGRKACDDVTDALLDVMNELCGVKDKPAED